MADILNIRKSTTENIISNGEAVITLQNKPLTIKRVIINNTVTTDYKLNENILTLNTVPTNGANIAIDYIYYSGLPVLKGRDGIDAKSTYTIACDNGYEGTEQDFYKDLANLGNALLLTNDVLIPKEIVEENLFDGNNSGFVPSSDNSGKKFLDNSGTWRVINLEDDLGITVTVSELNHMDGIKSNVQEQLEELGEATEEALVNANKYTDGKISDLLDGADDKTLDSIKELADAIKNNDSAIDALNEIAAGKANSNHNHDNVYSKLDHTHTASDVGAFPSHSTVFTGSLDDITIEDGIYTLDEFSDDTSPLKNFIYGTFVQFTGIYRTQMIIGSTSGSTTVSIFIRRYYKNASSWGDWSTDLANPTVVAVWG